MARPSFFGPSLSSAMIAAFVVLGLAALAVLAFAIEIIGIMRQWADTSRPAKLSVLLATWLGKMAKAIGELLALLADFPGLIRRLALWIRRVFFACIPEAVFKEALDTFGQAFHILWRVPLQFLKGIIKGLREGTIPLLNVVLFILGTLVAVPLWEFICIGLQLPGILWPTRLGINFGRIMGACEPVLRYIRAIITDLPAAIKMMWDWIHVWFPQRVLDEFYAEIETLKFVWRSPWVVIPFMVLVVALLAYASYKDVFNIAGIVSFLAGQDAPAPPDPPAGAAATTTSTRARGKSVGARD